MDKVKILKLKKSAAVDIQPHFEMLNFREKVKKMANRTSHRYNRLPLLPSGPGGVQQELVVPACRGQR